MKPEVVMIEGLCGIVEALLDTVSKYEDFTEKIGFKNFPKIDKYSVVEAVASARDVCGFIAGKENKQENRNEDTVAKQA